MNDMISWFATAATVGGVLLTASNLGTRTTGSGFIILLFGSLSWIVVSLISDQQALLWTNVVLTFLNIFGIWRWLGRQAAVEEGAKAAAAASEDAAAETLFPVSLLGRAKVSSAAGPFGTCVDAMAGTSSGRLAYVVVSEGGVAGLGERLFKVPWSEARFEGEELIAARAGNLQELEKDEWPAR